ncbi:DoxX family protein [Ulvibacter antarcticus]|uniref:DoxX-like protein n=1 Tax=Ulvibacter antarcticus TaxID=442714 RepID=A0A3L9YZQ6_9FLAO|nr:DoxX family membrane protein [Ulvibacter antarcticus]RMA66063.1 DoxX-like protein [Ulvibacter antarcticus]
MKIFHTILRIGLGLMLLIFGLNKFFWILPDFDFSGYPQAEYLFNSMRYSWSESINKGYLMGLVGITETVAGLLLILKKWVPFALLLLVPISVNIVLFHAFLNIPNIGPALLVAILNTYMIYKNWDSYRSIFT